MYVVWYSIFLVATIMDCSLISIGVMAVISYFSILRVIKLFKADMRFFCCFIISVQYISKLCHWLFWRFFMQLLHLICRVPYNLFYIIFMAVYLQWMKNISTSKWVVYTPFRQLKHVDLFCIWCLTFFQDIWNLRLIVTIVKFQ